MFGNNYSNPYGYVSPYGYAPAYPNYTQTNQQNSAVNPAPTAPSTNTNKIFVNGMADVRSRILPPNSDYAFLDNDKPLLYQKIVDSKGQFEVKVFDIIPHKEDTTPTAPSVDLSKYVLKTDFDKLTTEIADLKAQLTKLGGVKDESVEQQ